MGSCWFKNNLSRGCTQFLKLPTILTYFTVISWEPYSTNTYILIPQVDTCSSIQAWVTDTNTACCIKKQTNKQKQKQTNKQGEMLIYYIIAIYYENKKDGILHYVYLIWFDCMNNLNQLTTSISWLLSVYISINTQKCCWSSM